MPGKKAEGWPTTVKEFDKRLNKLGGRMDKLSRRRDGGKLEDRKFYVEYLPLQELFLELQQRRSAMSGPDDYRQR